MLNCYFSLKLNLFEIKVQTAERAVVCFQNYCNTNKRHTTEKYIRIANRMNKEIQKRETRLNRVKNTFFYSER